jgi:hypothetical protein
MYLPITVAFWNFIFMLIKTGLATQEAEIRRIVIGSQPRQIV